MRFAYFKKYLLWLLLLHFFHFPSEILANQKERELFPPSLRELLQAAEKGDPESQYRLGLIYEKGQGIALDDKEAREWYSSNDEKSFEWYLKSAQQGYALAQSQVGFMYRNGFGVSKDLKKSFEWYTKAAQQGETLAQYILGEMYQKGEAVTPNALKALEWYEQSANKGFTAAQYNLAIMYEKGQGIPQDIQKAKELYARIENEKGLPIKNKLGGKEILQDPVKQFIYPKVCKSGLYLSPNQKYAVYIFCDDAAGTSIGVINLSGYEYFTEKSKWNFHNRFWQEEVWCRDVFSIEWSKNSSEVTIVTNDIYGSGKTYILDLQNRKILTSK